MKQQTRAWAGLTAAALMGLSMSARADINIGVVVSLTGPQASLGIPANNTIKLWPHEMAGQKVNVIVLNDNSDSTTASVDARKLVTENKVDMLVGSSTTPATVAMLPVAAESQTPLFSLAGGGAIVEPPTGVRKWAFKFTPTEDFALRPLLDHFQRNKLHTLAFIGVGNAFGEGYARLLKTMAAERNIRIVADERYSATDQSVVGQVAKIMSEKPDAVLIAASGTPGALPEIELAQRNYKGVIYQTQAIANNDFLRVGGRSIEGTYLSLIPLLVAEQLPNSDPIKPVAMRYISVYEGKYGPGSRSLFSSIAWDAGLLIQNAVAIALKTSQPGTPAFRAALRDAMEHTREFVGTGGVFDMSPTDHNGLDQRCQILARIQNGKWVLVK